MRGSRWSGSAPRSSIVDLVRLMLHWFDIVEERGLDGLVVSRASWFRDPVELVDVTQAPVVGGTTVWEAVPNPAGRLFVVDVPNYLGRFETDPPQAAEVATIDHRAANGFPDEALRVARHLASSLTQIPGVKLPHGQPESPWFVVSLRASAARTAAALAGNGFVDVVALGDAFPEFPGGLRVKVAWPQHENTRFCTIVRSVG